MLVVEVEPAALADTYAELVVRARAGDGPAYDALYRLFAPSVHAILLARLDPDAADEATQEVFVAAHARLCDLREAGAFGPWVHAIARNAALTRLRTARRRPRALPLREDGEEAALARAGEGDGAGELRERVLHHIRGLPEAYRETLLMRLVEGVSGPEIADRTGLTPASVRVTLCRGMALLRPLLEKEGWP